MRLSRVRLRERLRAAAKGARTSTAPDGVEPARSTGRARRALSSAGALARRHWLFALLLGLGAALRAVTFFAYPPALLSADSLRYLRHAELLSDWPSPVKPVGYPAFLRLLPLEHLAVVSLVQHLLGLAIACLLYALLARIGVRAWAAALATVPVLLDSYQLNIEQYVLSETVFEVLVLAACALLLWRPLTFPAAALVGVLLAAATLTRVVGLLLIVPALLAAVLLRARWSRLAVLLVALAFPLGGYAVWFHSVHGVYALSTYQGRHLYGRVLTFADCSQFTVPRYERVLCVDDWDGRRPTQNQLVWSPGKSPIYAVRRPRGMTRNEVAADFAKRAIRHQPLDYARTVLSDFLRYFAPTKTSRPGELNIRRWQFGPVYRVLSPRERFSLLPDGTLPRLHPRPADSEAARFIRAYQRVGFTPGPVLAVGFLLGLCVAAGIGRTRSSTLRWGSFLFSAAGLALALGTTAVELFSWRYQLPELILLPPALVLSLTAVLTRSEVETTTDTSRRPTDRAVSAD